MPENENNNQQQQGDPAALGDAGKAALVAERKRADDAEKALKEANAKLKAAEDADKTDLEKANAEIERLKGENATLTADASTKDLTILKLNTGISEGLPANLIARLQGTDEASFKADAASLLELVPDTSQSLFPKADPSQGPKGETGKTTTGQQFADAVSDMF